MDATPKGTVAQIFDAIDGQKTHIACAVGIIAVTYSHLTGTKIPGVNIDDSQWLATDWQLLLGMCGRDAVRKIEDMLGGEGVVQGVAAAVISQLQRRSGQHAEQPDRQAPTG